VADPLSAPDRVPSIKNGDGLNRVAPKFSPAGGLFVVDDDSVLVGGTVAGTDVVRVATEVPTPASDVAPASSTVVALLVVVAVVVAAVGVEMPTLGDWVAADDVDAGLFASPSGGNN
jgi:hypothetical protein